MTKPACDVISPVDLLNAYCSGYFPMADAEDGKIYWYYPEDRGIFPLDGLNISRSLRRTIARNTFSVTVDTAFEDVMRCCAERDETWISDTIIRSYAGLFELGYAHSVETRVDGELVGGLYGVSIGGAFFGESMFSTVTDASKVALAALVLRMNERGYSLLDTQFVTPHLLSLGAEEITRDEYLEKLRAALAQQCTFTS
jgi:leucyl/phenylalanyl-tRNA--protein transferase